MSASSLELLYNYDDDVFTDKFKDDDDDDDDNYKSTLNNIWKQVYRNKWTSYARNVFLEPDDEQQIDINVDLCASIIQLSNCMSEKFEDIYTKLENLETKYDNMCDKIANLETKHNDTSDKLEDLKIEHDDLKSAYEYPYTCHDC